MGYELVAAYEDLEAPGNLLYHRPGLKAAINNIKELEEWEVLVVADPRCVSDTESALHEFVHKFSLYGNRLESPIPHLGGVPLRDEDLPAGDEPALTVAALRAARLSNEPTLPVV